MKKYDNFVNRLDVLKKADRIKAENDEIYRMGVIGQFNLTFELAWKVLQNVLRIYGMAGSEIGSARDILKLGYKSDFISDDKIWLDMLKKRNMSVHIYDEKEAEEIIASIFERYINVFDKLAKTLKVKIEDYEEDR